MSTTGARQPEESRRNLRDKNAIWLALFYDLIGIQAYPNFASHMVIKLGCDRDTSSLAAKNWGFLLAMRTSRARAQQSLQATAEPIFKRKKNSPAKNPSKPVPFLQSPDAVLRCFQWVNSANADSRRGAEAGSFQRDRRIYVATYPTMLNIVRDEANPLSPFFFDLVVIDESHRSIYNTYGEVLNYFHAIKLGLTATPRDVVDHNTFALFECEDDYRAETNMHAELKWTKVSPQKLPEYKRFIDYLFALNNANQVHFHSLLIDNHQVDHKRFSGGDKELGFYKFYYQLLLHAFGRRYCQKQQVHRLVVHLDHRNSSYSLDTLKKVLNKGMAKKFRVPGNPFVSGVSSDGAGLTRKEKRKTNWASLEGTLKHLELIVADFMTDLSSLPSAQSGCVLLRMDCLT